MKCNRMGEPGDDKKNNDFKTIFKTDFKNHQYQSAQEYIYNSIGKIEQPLILSFIKFLTVATIIIIFGQNLLWKFLLTYEAMITDCTKITQSYEYLR